MSKDLFLMMREQEVNTTNFLPSKKELKKSSLEFANGIVESGDYNITEVYSQALRLKESLTTIESILKDSLPLDNFEAFGIKATYRNGGDTINFKEDEVIQQLEKKIAERKELLKVALKSENSIYDSEGFEVPKVSKTPRKSGLSVSF
jgi:HD superfamily phosphodiesterase